MVNVVLAQGLEAPGDIMVGTNSRHEEPDQEKEEKDSLLEKKECEQYEEEETCRNAVIEGGSHKSSRLFSSRSGKGGDYSEDR